MGSWWVAWAWCAWAWVFVASEEEDLESVVLRRDVHSVLRKPLQGREILHRISVRGEDGQIMGHLELGGFDEVADAAYAFGVRFGLPRSGTRRLTEAVCGGSGWTAAVLSAVAYSDMY